MRVVDLGAGTGKLTRELVAIGHDVIAVEPSPEMARWLNARGGDFEVRSGSAESIPLPDATADVVVAAQAYHWFEPERALPEIARVLRPRGTLGLLWNMRDGSVPWVARLSGAIGLESLSAESPQPSIDASGLFEDVETRSFRYEQQLDRDGLVDLAASRSWVGTRSESQRAEILAEVRRIYDAEAGDAGVTLPYVTLAYRAQRR